MSIDKEKISVIVPIYNIEKYLSKCIDSIINQSYNNLEVILVDDGSTDGSGYICDQYAKKDSRILVVHKKNGGVSSARNKGLDLATGEYIGFVDGDDCINSDFFLIMAKAIRYKKSDFVCCGVKNIKKNNNNMVHAVTKDIVLSKLSIENQFFKNNTIKDLMYAPWNKLYKKELLKNIRFNENLSIGEDILFEFEYLQNCTNGYFIRDVLYDYVYRSDSAMNNDKIKRQEEYLNAAKYILDICRGKKCEIECELWFAAHIINYIYNCKKMKISANNYKKYIKFINRKKIIFNLPIKLKIKYVMLRFTIKV